MKLKRIRLQMNIAVQVKNSQVSILMIIRTDHHPLHHHTDSQAVAQTALQVALQADHLMTVIPMKRIMLVQSPIR